MAALAVMGSLMLPEPTVAQASAVIDTMPTRLPTSLGWMSAETTGARAYIFGGHTATLPYVLQSRIYEYVPDTDGLAALAATLPTPRGYMASAYDGSRYVYLFGGLVAFPASATNQVLRFDTSTLTLSTLPATLPVADLGIRAAWVAGKAYLFGGYYCGSPCPVRVFDPGLGTVTTLVAAFPANRYASMVATDGTEIFIFGGRQAGTTTFYNDIWKFVPATSTLSSVPTVLPTRLSSGAAVYDGARYLVIGGYDASVSTDWDRILTFNPTSYAVADYPKRLPQRSHTMAAVWGPTGYVFGGWTMGPADEIYCFDCTPDIDFSCSSDGAVEHRIRLSIAAPTTKVGTIARQEWDYGDGTTLTTTGVAPASYDYAAPGTYMVTVTVWNSLGLSYAVTRPCTALANMPPFLDAPAMVTAYACMERTIALRGGDPEDQIAWSWHGAVPPGRFAAGDQVLIWNPQGATGPFDAVTIRVDEVRLGAPTGRFVERIVALESVACASPSGPASGDADGDGAPNTQDNCPNTRGDGATGGCATEPANEPTEPGAVESPNEAQCQSSPTPWGAVASREGSSVLLEWLHIPCPGEGYLVWRDGELVGAVPFDVPPFRFEDLGAASSFHTYWIQVATNETDFSPAAAVHVTYGPLAEACASCTTPPTEATADEVGHEARNSARLAITLAGIVLTVAMVVLLVWRQRSRGTS
jgi:PKD repeat protein